MTSTHSPTILRAQSRGVSDLGWLYSHHSFSFGGYQDPARMGFRALRVLNDDIIQGGSGFSAHGHDNMEIISWVLDGALAHRDSTGTDGVLFPGDAQVMTAGSGIRHSEMNGSTTDPAHFIQIWILPSERNVEPRYDQKTFYAAARTNAWQRIADGKARDGALPIQQDASVSVADLDPGASLTFDVPEGRFGYLHVATGVVRVGEETLHAGDALELSDPATLEMEGVESAQLLAFDLA